MAEHYSGRDPEGGCGMMIVGGIILLFTFAFAFLVNTFWT